MVARRGNVVADEIHRLDRGVGIARCDPGVVVGKRFALDEVARVHHDHSPGIARAEGVDDGRRPGEAAGERAVGDVVPLGGVTVNIGGGDENEMKGVGGRDGDCRAEQQGAKHGGEYTGAVGR